MIVLDTNVVSELTRPEPAREVVSWVDGQPYAVTTAVTAGELRLGVALLPPGRRRDSTHDRVQKMLTVVFHGRVLAYDEESAVLYGSIVASRRREGRPIGTADAQIAAIAASHGAALATRNVDDFLGTGVEVVDPWTGVTHPA